MAEPGGERVLAGLGRPVDEVRRPGTHTGHARQHHERAVTLRPQPAGNGQPGRHGADVVHLGEFGRCDRIVETVLRRVVRTPGSPRRGRRTVRRGRRSAPRARRWSVASKPTRTISASPNDSSGTGRPRPASRTASTTVRSAGDARRRRSPGRSRSPPPRTRIVWGCLTALFTGSPFRWVHDGGFGMGGSTAGTADRDDGPDRSSRRRFGSTRRRTVEPFVEAGIFGPHHRRRGCGVLGEVVTATGVERPVRRARPAGDRDRRRRRADRS